MLASCASKATQRLKTVDAEFDKGDYIGLAEAIKKDGEKKYGENSAFLYHMDLGVLYHYAEQYEQSNTHFKRAAEIHYDLFTKSVTNEAAALLTNDNVRPYRSKPYELTMLHQIAALNFMLMGDFDGALVESRKAQLLFDEWERTLAKDGKFHTDGMFHLMTSLAYERTGEEDNSLISIFKSVDAYNKGPIRLPPEVSGFAYNRLKTGDREDDIGRLGIRSDKGGGNGWDAKFGDSEIVVVSHIGRGPAMYENNWHGTYHQGGSLTIHTTNKKGKRLDVTIPAPPLPAAPDGRARNVSDAVAVKISLPEMVEYGSVSDHFTATVDGGATVTSVMLNDIEVHAKKDLDDSWGEIVGRTVVRMIIRTLAANETKNRVNTGNPLANALISVGTDVATDQMEKADIRMCTILPHQIHVARIPVEPGTHSVTVEIYNKQGRAIGHNTFSNIDVKRGEKKVLMYNSLR